LAPACVTLQSMLEPTLESGTDGLRSSIEAAADILRTLGAREVYVFGSAARGSLRSDSDVDLAVSGLPPAVFFRAASRAADALGRPADLVDLDDDSPAVKYLRASGELIRVR
jgi:predicted nucleotidyltransferase